MKIRNAYWLLILLLYACSEEGENQFLNGNTQHTTRIEYHVIEAENIPRLITVPGTILPFEQVDLHSEVSGILEKIHFREGQKVNKGQLLAKIDSDVLLAERNQLFVDLDLAKKDEERKRKLHEIDAVNLEELEQAEARRASLDAQVQLLDVQIDKTAIRAPFSGQIGLRQVSEGAYVTPSTQIARLAQNDKVKIDFAVAQRYARNVALDQRVKIFSTGDTTKYTATVYAFEPSVEAGTRMLRVRAVMDANQYVFPGSFVKVEYDLGEVKNGMMVPTSALTPVLNGQQIWIMKNGRAKPVLIEPGIRTANRVQVTGDIRVGDTVITTGLLAMREGMNVEGKLSSE